MIFNKVQTSAGKKMLESKKYVDYEGVLGKASNETNKVKVWVFIRIPAIPVILFEWDAEGESLREVRLRVQLQAKTNLGIELIAKEFLV